MFTIGWEEWISLPDLGLPALKTKVDTGARTSALHASVIEPFGSTANPQVRFLIQPNPDDPRLEITCSAKVVDQRNVTSSNGETELRFVIRTQLQIGERTWPVEVTLTNRESMAYRMLVGRTSIPEDVILESESGPKVLEVNSSPGLEGIESATGVDLAGKIIEHLETQVRPLARHS
ncbi:MAG: RimK/LysX family protein [Pseudomonadota bacterium]